MGVEHRKSQRGRRVREEEGSITKNLTDCSGKEQFVLRTFGDIIIAMLFIIFIKDDSFCSRQRMIQATVTIHSPLTSPTWLFQGTCKYGRNV